MTVARSCVSVARRSGNGEVRLSNDYPTAPQSEVSEPADSKASRIAHWDSERSTDEGGGRYGRLVLVRIAKQWYCCHYEGMPVQITIRGVPEAVRDKLAARAALKRQSMQEFLRGELERIASRPTIDAWLAKVRSRKSLTQTHVSSSDIVRARDADRT